MRAGGMSQNAITKAFGVDKNTLKRACKTELDSGKAEIDGKVIGSLVQAALKGNVTAQIFYLKTRCRWREVDRRETTTGKEFKRYLVQEIAQAEDDN
jgi:hypothetical protein